MKTIDDDKRFEAFLAVVTSEIILWDGADEALHDAGVPITMTRLLPLHYLQDGPMRLQELARRCFCKESALSRRIERMCADGLVSKRRDAADGRGVVLCLTDQGRDIAERAWAVFAEYLAGLFPDEDAHSLEAALSLHETIRSRLGGGQ